MRQLKPTKTKALIDDLVSSSGFKRLKRVSFLGIIDHFNSMYSSNSTKRFSRADHSLGVLEISLSIAKKILLDDDEIALLSAASILHDIGHPPMSHSLEFAFPDEQRHLNHHKILRGLLLDSTYGNLEIQRILKKHGLSPEEVLDVIDFNGSSKLGFLFNSPINIDTIDGISRFFWSFNLTTPYSLGKLIEFISQIYTGKSLQDKTIIDAGDSFWEQKDAFYNSFLQDGIYAKIERSFQQTLRKSIRKISREDFFLEESYLLKQYPTLKPRRHVDNKYAKTNRKYNFKIDDTIMSITKNNIQNRYIRANYENI